MPENARPSQSSLTAIVAVRKWRAAIEGVAGSETTVARYDAACSPGGSAELWTIVGGGHVPTLSPSFSGEVIAWLLARVKPQAQVAGAGLARGTLRRRRTRAIPVPR